MKNIYKYVLVALFVISLVCNGLLCFILIREKKTIYPVIKFGYDMHDTFIYCENYENTYPVRCDYNKNSFTIGKSKILYDEDALYFINNKEKITLSDYEGCGFVINSEGELLYSIDSLRKKQQTVYITPTGIKYHINKYCAGKTGVEISLESAKLLKEPCCICAQKHIDT